MEQTVSRRELADRLKVSTRTLHNWQKKGILPPPDYQVEHCERWKVSTIETALAGRQPRAA